jgi:hypothetical protein
MAGRTIKTNLALRVKGWRAAVKSPRTPSELKPGLRRLIREASRRLRRQAVDAGEKRSHSGRCLTGPVIHPEPAGKDAVGTLY